jgi:hypothetical protein
MDLEDAQRRLERMHRAIEARDQAAEEVRQLTQKLASAKRRLKEAGWNLTSVVAAERHRQQQPHKEKS